VFLVRIYELRPCLISTCAVWRIKLLPFGFYVSQLRLWLATLVCAKRRHLREEMTSVERPSYSIYFFTNCTRAEGPALVNGDELTTATPTCQETCSQPLFPFPFRGNAEFPVVQVDCSSGRKLLLPNHQS